MTAPPLLSPLPPGLGHKVKRWGHRWAPLRSPSTPKEIMLHTAETLCTMLVYSVCTSSIRPKGTKRAKPHFSRDLRPMQSISPLFTLRQSHASIYTCTGMPFGHVAPGTLDCDSVAFQTAVTGSFVYCRAGNLGRGHHFGGGGGKGWFHSHVCLSTYPYYGQQIK